jgi:hypothetical protein
MINIFKIIFDYCYGIKNIKMMKIKKKKKRILFDNFLQDKVIIFVSGLVMTEKIK